MFLSQQVQRGDARRAGNRVRRVGVAVREFDRVFGPPAVMKVW